jgi:hypothetical protein
MGDIYRDTYRLIDKSVKYHFWTNISSELSNLKL